MNILPSHRIVTWLASVRRLSAVALLAGTAATMWAAPSDNGGVLLNGFQSPPDSAKPRVWWHWMNGNISREGIAADFAWMKRVGIGGVQNFDVALNTPQVVDKRIVYMTPEWKDTFRYTIELAQQSGLEFGIASSPGWSETGGPWVTPEQAMKKVVWSRTEIIGGAPFSGKLPRPPNVAGTFQDAVAAGGFEPLVEKENPIQFYRDSVILAFPTPVDEMQPERALSNSRPVNPAELTDGKLQTGASVVAGPDGKAWLQYEFAQPQNIQAVTLAMPSGGMAAGGALPVVLEASNDGSVFKPVKEFTVGFFSQATVSFSPVKAKFFRLTLASASSENWFALIGRGAAPGAAVMSFGGDAPAGPPSFTVNEFVLHQSARVNQFEAKAAFTAVPDYYEIDSVPAAAGTMVAKSAVIDLTGKMDKDGTLHWTPPAGRWTVLRLGYSLTGHKNGPAPREATGLETDKLSRQHVKAYLDHYLEMYAEVVGAENMGRKGVQVFLTDSIEAGLQNWTDDMIAEFKRLRGYDPTPWLPTLTGVVIENAQASDQFLWDFRRTIAQLIADIHYGQVAESAHALGMTVYGEALESHRPTIGDDMEMRRFANIPMAAMWSFKPADGPQAAFVADDRGAASVAHLYGQNLVAAESLTSAFNPWAHAPRDLKQIIDLEFALGINRPVIHTSVHQPLMDRKPGMSLMIFGQYFGRTESWAEQAGAWVSYISRNAYMLQQGRFFADVAYFYGEEAPLVSLYGDKLITDAPEGYAFDFVNSHALLNLFKADQGELVTPSGMRYRVLYLGGSSRRMTLPVLKKLHELVSAGAVVVGARPEGSPSLADDEKEFNKLADQLWPKSGSALVGKGRVMAGMSVNEALALLKVPADFSYTKPLTDTELMFVHRKLEDGDVYYVNNRKDRAENLEVTFRVAGKEAELWHAETGLTEKVSYMIEGDQTKVPLMLKPFDSVYVVFRHPTKVARYVAPKLVESESVEVTGDWAVAFAPDLGAPAIATFDPLASWSDSADRGIKHFSGTATYTKTIDVPAGMINAGKKLSLDLGEVRELAEVSINGKPLGIVWHPPYKVDVSGVLKPGANTLEVKVTNLWVNRLIGDQQPDAEKKYTFTAAPTYKPDAPLRASGLLGPVRLSASSFAQ